MRNVGTNLTNIKLTRKLFPTLNIILNLELSDTSLTWLQRYYETSKKKITTYSKYIHFLVCYTIIKFPRHILLFSVLQSSWRINDNSFITSLEFIRPCNRLFLHQSNLRPHQRETGMQTSLSDLGKILPLKEPSYHTCNKGSFFSVRLALSLNISLLALKPRQALAQNKLQIIIYNSVSFC